MQHNRISLNDLKIILRASKDITFLDISGNPIGPNLTSDTFAGFHKMVHLNMEGCGLRHIESRSFRAMNKLKEINLDSNKLSRIDPGTFEGLSEDLLKLCLQNNGLTTIADGTFRRFRNLSQLRLEDNKLTTVPDLTGVTVMSYL
ncbi:insulin-like growth factor-binding protein complex acid labile subunit [Orbicella faveolata]|uniref:insulin-like growth factor-binding protein complex acid labile subunit n=1 Tax=Orbicella faveolata TaxID=48498 RepID=UPI0009E21F3D|nr:insulin-like growth factor-binding protein complex acid labile subunit [Orbicella faveolata]